MPGDEPPPGGRPAPTGGCWRGAGPTAFGVAASGAAVPGALASILARKSRRCERVPSGLDLRLRRLQSRCCAAPRRRVPRRLSAVGSAARAIAAVADDESDARLGRCWASNGAPLKQTSASALNASHSIRRNMGSLPTAATFAADMYQRESAATVAQLRLNARSACGAEPAAIFKYQCRDRLPPPGTPRLALHRAAPASSDSYE